MIYQSIRLGEALIITQPHTGKVWRTTYPTANRKARYRALRDTVSRVVGHPVVSAGFSLTTTPHTQEWVAA